MLAVDLHAGQIRGFFDIPTDNLYAAPTMAADVLARRRQPDGGFLPTLAGGARPRAVAAEQCAPRHCRQAARPAGVSEVMNVIGEVSGRHCILIDDIIDSGRHALQCRPGADRAWRGQCARLSHPRGALGKAVRRVDASVLTELVITDTILPTEATRNAEDPHHSDCPADR